MPSVNVFTAERMQQVEDNTITGAEIIDGNLILQRYDGSVIDAGPVGGGGGGADVSLDADGTLNVDGVIVDLGTDVAVAAAIVAAISSEVTSRNAAIDAAIAAEETARDVAISASIASEVVSRNAAIVTSSAAILDGATFTGELVVPDLSVTGLTGSVLPSRYCGRTAGGKPTTGTHAVGDFVIGHSDGIVWLCTGAGVAGTSTWVRMGGDTKIIEVESEAAQSGITTVVDITGMLLTAVEVTVGGQFILEAAYVYHTLAANNALLEITDNANVIKSQTPSTSGTANGIHHVRVVEQITAPGIYTRKGRIVRLSASGSVGIGAGAASGYWTRMSFVGR